MNGRNGDNEMNENEIDESSFDRKTRELWDDEQALDALLNEEG